MSKSVVLDAAGRFFVMPGLASAHSHAFQRALRGRTQRRLATPGSFWSWRGLMYELVEKLSPEDIFDISRFAFVELAMSGVTAVGEFHYVHHDRGGVPYADRTLLAERVIDAALAAGIRLTLIRTAYLRAGYQQELASAQRRFVDDDVDAVLRDVAHLRDRYANEPTVGVGLAAHSIRAVPIAAVKELVSFARESNLPFHMHVSEQQRELDECSAEYGLPPVALLAETGVLHEGFVAVHATHLSDDEVRMLAESQATVCLCRTTERDLGDGLARTSDLVQAGVRLCIGVDSHASSDAFEEIRAVELDERSRKQARTVAADADQLLTMATQCGYDAIGMLAVADEDTVELDATDAALAHSHPDLLNDAVVFGATPRAVRTVTAAGRRIVEDGRHVIYEQAAEAYGRSLRRLGLL